MQAWTSLLVGVLRILGFTSFKVFRNAVNAFGALRANVFSHSSITCSLMNKYNLPCSEKSIRAHAAPPCESTPEINALLSKNNLLFDIVFFIVALALFIQCF